MKERRYRLVHEELNHVPGRWLKWDTLSNKEIPPGARVLTREELVKSIERHNSRYGDITAQRVVRELFGDARKDVVKGS